MTRAERIAYQPQRRLTMRRRNKQEFHLGDRVVLRDNTTATGTISSTKPRGPSKDEYFVRFDEPYYAERLVRASDLFQAEAK